MAAPLKDANVTHDYHLLQHVPGIKNFRVNGVHAFYTHLPMSVLSSLTFLSGDTCAILVVHRVTLRISKKKKKCICLVDCFYTMCSRLIARHSSSNPCTAWTEECIGAN